MRKAIILLACWVAAWGMAGAATSYYVDLACPTAGNGTSPNCLSSLTTNNPKKTIPTGRALLASPGDVLYIRGIHGAHDVCPGSTKGRYTLDDMDGLSNVGTHFTINSLGGASGNPIIIRNYASEKVFLDGTVTPGGSLATSWQVCPGTTNACGSPCQILNRGSIPCSEVFFTTGQGMGHFSLLPTGDPTYRVAGLWDMTNAHTSQFTGKVCAGPGNDWMRCISDADCPIPLTCSVVHQEYDSVGNNTNGSGSFTQWVRWGPGGPPAEAYPVTASNFNGGGPFAIIGSSSWITVQGLIFRGHAHPLLVGDIGGAPQHIVIDGVQDWYTTYAGGDDYAAAFTGHVTSTNDVTDITLKNSVLAFSTSENFHSDPNTGAGDSNGAMVIKLQNNYFLGAGHPAVLSNHKIRRSTAQCVIIGNGVAGGSSGLPPKYAGSEISGNVCSDIYAWGGDVLGSCHTTSILRCRDVDADCPNSETCDAAASISDYHGRGSGIVLENGHIGLTTIKDNIFVRVAGFNFETDCNSPEGISLVDYFNNLSIQSMSYNNSNYCAVTFNHNSGCVTDQVNIFNNTSYGPIVRPFLCKTGSGTVTNFKYRNNLLAGDWGGTKLIDWSGGGAPNTSIQNNLLFASGVPASSTIATINGINFNPDIAGAANKWTQTKDVDGDAAADANVWGDPGWTLADCSLNDYRLHPTNAANQANPAIDAGTMTGMPARTGIHNIIAASHGLPNYSRLQTTNIGSLPDIGAWEMLLKDGSFESGSIDAPWNVPLGALTICPFYPTSISTGATGGTKAMNLTTGPCLESVCSSNCRKMIVQQVFTGLEVGRTYSLIGSWKVVSGAPDPTAFVAFVSCTAAECALDPFNSDPPACSILIGGDSSVGFVCPNFMIPSASSMTIAIIPNTNFGVVVAIDNLELR